MGSCPSCGASSFFSVSTKQCVFCGKIVCNKCVPNWHGQFQIKTMMESPSSFPFYQTVGFCSDNCYYQFWENVQKYPVSHIIGTEINGFSYSIQYAWNQAILNSVANDLKAMAQNSIQIHSPNNPSFPWWDGKKVHLYAYAPFYSKAKLALAENLEKCGRIQDAARIFEELHMYDKSRELRQQDRHILIKNTNVSVNLNSLLQQVKDGGIVAVFRCPFCGGKLKVNQNSTLDSLKKCEHCNSDIATMDLADFLKTVLT
jgi:hypothetical protein